MKIGKLIPSKFLKKDDFPEPALVTVSEVKLQDVSKPGEDAEEKGVMYFREYEKGMVMNSTNVKRGVKLFGSDDTDDWPGQKCVVYNDPTVEFGGQVIGGLRLRAPKKAPPPILDAEELENEPQF